MFAIYTETPSLFSEICDEVRLFLPEEKRIQQLNEKTQESAGNLLRHFFWRDEMGWHNRAEYYIDGELKSHLEEQPSFKNIKGEIVDITQDGLLAKKLKKHAVKQLVYRVMHQFYQKDMPWGGLTGIRPTKFLRELANEHGIDKAKSIFVDVYDVSKEKTKLAADICAVQEPFLQNRKQSDVDIYIGIPFCVTRCKYCSFISRDLKFNESIKNQYLPCLLHEMEAMREVLKQYTVRTVYIGGGTPTALEVHDLEAVLKKAKELFPEPLEFTVEAGRPDTATKEKLELLKEYGVQRISINAQTTNDRTLEIIGRKHTASEFKDAFFRAKEIGFQSINTDIILGLPYETLLDVEKTLVDLMEFEPDNVTVHTLALKNASEFVLDQQNGLPKAEEVLNMVEFSQQFLMENGYLPYYLYRQKYMSGNLENVGFCKPGKECIYNIDIMEETVSNLAFGAGAISKKLYPEKNLLKRVPNVKDLKHYIERTDEMIQRKKAFF